MEREKKQLQEFKQQRITHVATVIDAPIDEVRAMAWDFDGQSLEQVVTTY